MGQVSGKDVGQAYNTVGTAAIWWKIISASITAVICFFIIIYFNFFYRSNWKTTKATILSENCIHKTEKRTTRTRRSSTTRDVEVQECTHNISFIADGTEYKTDLVNKERYLESDNEEDMESYIEIDIQYDPDEPKKTATFPFPKYMVNLIVGIIMVICILSAIFWYVLRKNKIAKGFAMFSTAGDMMGDSGSSPEMGLE